MAQGILVEWGFSRQAKEEQRSESTKTSAKPESGHGPVRYDPVQGIWVQLEESEAATAAQEALQNPEPAASPAPSEAVQPQQESARESSPPSKRSWWFRNESDESPVSIRPPADPVTPVAQTAETLQDGALQMNPPSPDGSSTTSELPSAEMRQESPTQPSTITPDQGGAVPQPSSAMLMETTSQSPSISPDQNEAASQPPSAPIGQQTPEPAPLPVTINSLGGLMWQSTSYADSAVATAPAAPETPQTWHGQDSSRWFGLKGVLGGAPATQEPAAAAPVSSLPVLEVFSLTGGVGKSSLVATLGRALSALGERVLLVEATPFGSLPYFFGACDSRPGVLRTFRPPTSSNDSPIRLATIDPEAPETAQDSLAADIQGWAQGVSRVIVDVATRSTATARALARLSPVVLVPLVPDLNSVLAASSIDSFFQQNAGAPGASPDVHYLLNQFDPSLPLHVEVRKVLRDKLGDRLLPFELQRTPSISEALAEGMTLMDYAPGSPMAEDFTSLAKWLETVAAPADMNSGSIRWSER